MSFKRAVVTAVILTATGIGAGVTAVPAFARGDTTIPAEFPPRSFEGRQYVDSRGCVYIRASTGGLVDWIPRVTRTREHICNAKPTFAGGFDRNLPVIPDAAPAAGGGVPTTVIATAPAAAPKPSAQPAAAPAPAPVRTVAKAPVASAAASAPKPRAPRFTLSSIFGTDASSAASSPTPRVAAPRPMPVPVIAPKPVRPAPVAPRVASVPVAPACGGGTSVSQRYLGTGSGVRCGPQAQSPIFGSASGSVSSGRANSGRVITGRAPVAAAPAVVPPVVSAVPRAVVQAPAARQVRAPVATTSVAAAPVLAPTRQPGDPVPVKVTPSKQAAQKTDPTEYVQVPGSQGRIAPRHVYEWQQKHAVTSGVPAGYRPLWQDDRLNPNRAHQTASGKAAMDLIWSQTVPRQLIDRVSGRDVTRHYPGLEYPHTSYAQQRSSVVVSSKSHAATAPVARKVAKQAAPKATSRTYVQVATFAQPDNAQRTAGALAAKGLPMRIWSAKRGGKPVQLVLVGPFADRGHATAALSIVRRSGFGDAYLR